MLEVHLVEARSRSGASATAIEDDVEMLVLAIAEQGLSFAKVDASVLVEIVRKVQSAQGRLP